ncbi:DNA-binding transcriptional dual regulator Crp [compost metagenome]
MKALHHHYQNLAINQSDLDKIMMGHELVQFSKNDFLLRKDEKAYEYYILESGLVRSFIHDYQGNEITTDFFGNHDIVIEVTSLFLQFPSPENLQCLTDCTAWKIDFNTFQTLYHTIPTFSEWGRSWMTFALHTNKKRFIDMVSLSATQRYQNLIKNKPQIIKQAALKYIASYLGITDTSLSRIRKEQ